MDEFKKFCKTKPVSIVADLLLVSGVYLVGQIVVLAVVRGAGIASAEELYMRPRVLLTAYIVGGVAALGGVLYAMKLRHMTFKGIALYKPGFKDIGYGLLGFGAYFIVVRIVLALVGVLFPSVNLNQSQNIGLQDMSSAMLPFAFVALALLPPLSEELLFRGFLYTRLRGYKISALTSALIVGVIFGAMHGQWNVSIDTFVLSMVMIYTMQYKKSLWVTITMHLLKNALAFVALFIFKIV